MTDGGNGAPEKITGLEPGTGITVKQTGTEQKYNMAEDAVIDCFKFDKEPSDKKTDVKVENTPDTAEERVQQVCYICKQEVLQRVW